MKDAERLVGMTVSCKIDLIPVRCSVSLIVPIVALETIGSDCFYHSITMNGPSAEVKKLPPNVSIVRDEKHDLYLAHFDKFSSRASGSLGASEPSAAVLRMALDRPGGVYSYSVPDEMSMGSLVKFAGECGSKQQWFN